MSIKRSIPALVLVFVFLLSACETGSGGGGLVVVGNNLVGRWVAYTNAEQTTGSVWEFLDDGSVVFYDFLNTTQLQYPALVANLDYSFATSTGLITLSELPRRTEYATAVPEAPTSVPLPASLAVTFVSEDEIILKPEGEAEGTTYLRIAALEIPLDSRAKLGKWLARDNYTAVSTEKFEGKWQDNYPDYVEVHSQHYVEKPGGAQWAVYARGPDEVEPSMLFLLIEGDGWWGMVVLKKQ